MEDLMDHYKFFLQSLSWDEFQTYKSNVNEDNLTPEQQQTLKEEAARRATAFNNYMSF
jgi:hypothetical protein